MSSRRSSVEYTPALSFSEDVFFMNDFDTDRFIARCRQTTTLENLSEDLRNFGNQLKNNLVELVNREYSNFVGLSSNLEGLNEATYSLSMPLQEIDQELRPVQKSLINKINQINAFESERRKNQEKLNVLRSLQLLDKLYNDLEQLLNEASDVIGHIQSSEREDSNDFKEILKRKEMICAAKRSFKILFHVDVESDEVAFQSICLLQLSSTLFRCSELIKGFEMQSKALTAYNITKNLSSSMQKLRNRFGELLKQCFIRCFNFTKSYSISQEFVKYLFGKILTSYSNVGFTSAVEEVFRVELVSPIVSKWIDVFSSSPSTDTLGRAYNGLMNDLEMNFKEFLASIDGIAGVSFYSQTIWNECANSLIDLGAALFTLGLPDKFKEHYSITLQFVQAFRKLAPNPREISKLKKNEKYVEFLGKWNLAVYLRLRSLKAMESVEQILEVPLTEQSLTLPCAKEFVSKPVEIVWNALAHLWSEQVFLSELSQDFLILTAMILKRYTMWIDKGLGIVDGVSEVKDGNVLGGSWNLKTVLTLICLNRDLNYFVERALPSLSASLAHLGLNRIFMHWSQNLEKYSQVFVAYISTKVCNLFNPVLIDGIGRIKTSYRAWKAVPDSPLPYIQESVAPILELNKNLLICGMDSIHSKEMLDRTISGYLTTYKSQIEDLLEAIRKTEAVLQKLQNQKSLYSSLKSGSQPSAPASVPMTQSKKDDGSVGYADLISIQLRMDMKQFQSIMAQVSIDISAHEPAMEAMSRSNFLFTP